MRNQTWNIVVLVAAAFALASILGFAYGASFSRGCATLNDAPFGCIEWWLARYQTFAAMVAAFVLAAFAAWPVYQELKYSSLQTAIALRDSYGEREKRMSQRAKKEMEVLRKFDEKMQSEYYWIDEDVSKLAHWTSDIGQFAMIIRDETIERQNENADGDLTMIARETLIGDLGRFIDCTSNYNASHWIEFDHEIEITDELRTRAAEDEKQAEIDLPHRISSVGKAIKSLQHAFEMDVADVRAKRQLLDQRISAAELNSP